MKSASDAEYPAYGVTGPNKEREAGGVPGDRMLAQSAQMYHYQHQKQQMIASERCIPSIWTPKRLGPTLRTSLFASLRLSATLPESRNSVCGGRRLICVPFDIPPFPNPSILTDACLNYWKGRNNDTRLFIRAYVTFRFCAVIINLQTDIFGRGMCGTSLCVPEDLFHGYSLRREISQNQWF